jgi:hypothetical protein
MSVTPPDSAPSRSATAVNGQRQRFNANRATSVVTTLAASRVRRSVRPRSPSARITTTHPSTTMKISECAAFTEASASQRAAGD